MVHIKISEWCKQREIKELCISYQVHQSVDREIPYGATVEGKLKVSCPLAHYYGQSKFGLCPFKKKFHLKLLAMSACSLVMIRRLLISILKCVCVCLCVHSEEAKTGRGQGNGTGKRMQTVREPENKTGTESKRKSYSSCEQREQRKRTKSQLNSAGNQHWYSTSLF